VTLVAHRREHWWFPGVLGGFWVARLPPKEVFEYTRIHSLIVNGIVTASDAIWRHFCLWISAPGIEPCAPDDLLILTIRPNCYWIRWQFGLMVSISTNGQAHRVRFPELKSRDKKSPDFISIESSTLTCLFEQSNLSAWSLLSWHPTHTYLWGRVCFIQVVCYPQSRRVTQIYVNRSASLKRFSGIVFTINELVDRISNFKFNASQNDQTEDFYANPPPQARYFTMENMHRQPDF